MKDQVVVPWLSVQLSWTNIYSEQNGYNRSILRDEKMTKPQILSLEDQTHSQETTLWSAENEREREIKKRDIFPLMY